MAHQLANVPHVLCDDKPPALLSQEQILEILSNLVPHMPRESQASFFAMFRGNTPVLPFREPPTSCTPPHLTISPDIVRSVVRAEASKHIYESDLAFEAKQKATPRTSRRSGRAGGVTKRYERPQQYPQAISPCMNMHTMPYGAPWRGRNVATPGDL